MALADARFVLVGQLGALQVHAAGVGVGGGIVHALCLHRSERGFVHCRGAQLCFVDAAHAGGFAELGVAAAGEH